MRINNVLVYGGEGLFAPGEIGIDGTCFGKVTYNNNGFPVKRGAIKRRHTEQGDYLIDAGGCYAIPGLIDVHLHGCAGYDFSEADSAELLKMLRYQAESGVTAVCPTLVTLPEDALNRACDRIAAVISAVGKSRDSKARGRTAGSSGAAESAGGAVTDKPAYAETADISADPNGSFGVSPDSTAKNPQDPDGDLALDSAATPVGVYLEGPFLSPAKAGAQNPAYMIKPDAAVYKRLREASNGHVKIVAVAPELEGAMEFIESFAGEAVISVAHSNTDFKTAAEAFRRGASLVTHLYNGMSGFTHREPNVVGAAFDARGVTAEIVCDGVHLHPASVRIATRLFDKANLVFVSDSMMATGLGDGVYELGGLAVNVSGKVARLVEGGNIASSVSNLMDCLRAAVAEAGVPLEDAVRYASANPARLLGVENERGSIAEGMSADLVLLDGGLNVKEVILRGKRVYFSD